jgi:hypothetical protein
MSSKSEKRQEKYPLPKDIDGICALVRRILNGGSVSRIELDNDDPVARAWRWVDKGDLEESAVSWDGALRNVRNGLEYASPGATSYQVLVDMMLLAQKEGPHATMWATGRGGKDLIREWLELEKRGMPIYDFDQLQGVPLMELKSLPADTLILCCSRYRNAEPEEITVTIKAAIEVRKDHEPIIENARQGGDYPQAYAAAVGPVAAGAGVLRRVAWRNSR